MIKFSSCDECGDNITFAGNNTEVVHQRELVYKSQVTTISKACIFYCGYNNKLWLRLYFGDIHIPKQ